MVSENKINNVFMVKSPLQLLNALEAMHAYDLMPEQCLLVLMGDRKSQPQMLALARDMNEWPNTVALDEVAMFGCPLSVDEVKINRMGSKSKFFSKSIFSIYRLNKISKSVGEVNKIFIGYPRYIYMKHFINVTPHDEVILLDDGSVTISIAQERHESVKSVPDIGLFRKIKLIGKRWLLGVKDKDIDSLCFYTVYDVDPGLRDSVVKNEFNYIKLLAKSLPKTSDVYFLGGPLGDAGIVTQDVYFEHLKRVKDYYSGSKLTYIAHRREKQSHLDWIAEKIGIKVVKYEYPIEYQFAMYGPLPKVMASFVSSALCNCNDIFGDEIEIVSFRLDLRGSARKDEVEMVYSNYEKIKSNSFVVNSNY